MKLLVFIFTTFLGALLAQTAAAQSDLTCPNYVRLNGVPNTALPDLVEPPVAFPGAFGGTIACVLSVDGTAIGGYFAEFLPSDGTIIQDIYYKYGSILSYLKFEGENEPRLLVATCTKTSTGGLICFTDIAAGEGFRIFRFFDAELLLTNVRVIALPGLGLLNELVWDAVKDKVISDPDTRVEIIISLPELAHPILLPLLSDPLGGHLAYGISGQPAYDFMVALYASENPLGIEMNIYDIAFNQRRKISNTQTISSGTYRFLIDHLAQIEQLITAGYEASKSLNFR